ncbi:MAG: HD domain-containing protein [Thermodesulfobacteriota bacterium]|nr:MAG: HD domain-containing protein [Thermodesulfobacteriota bacterium]
MNAEDILKGINGALRGTKLYPPGHPAIDKAARTTHELISNLLAGTENFVIALVDGALVFEEQPIADGDRLYPELMEYMTEKNVGTMVFERGVETGEVSALVDVLTTSDAGGKELSNLLRERGITHITLKALSEGKEHFLQVYNDAVNTVKGAMDEVRLGKIPMTDPVTSVVNKVTESVLADPNAMVGLTMIKNYDNYLYNHSVNVSILAVSLANAMNLTPDDIHAVGVGALLHDIGKTGVSEDIIRKPGGLSSEEWEKVKEHPLLGSEIIKRMEDMADMIHRFVYEHHIKYDLSGYPERHGAIHPYSQILTICDAYDALTTLRVYQKPHNPVEALKIMNNFSGRNFDPVILKAFSDMIGIFPVGTMVRLSTNEIGIVMRINPDAPDTPSVKILYDAEGSHLTEPIEVDLSGEAGKGKSIIATVNPASVDVELSAFFEKETA